MSDRYEFKKKVLAQFIAALEADHELLVRAALDARQAATHEESKAEDQYDTRGLEASYLAGAQANRALELEKIIGFYRLFELPKFEADAPITAGALVELEAAAKLSCYLLVPRGIGRAVAVDGTTVQVITVQSPLGALLIGKSLGEGVELRRGGSLIEFEIASVV